MKNPNPVLALIAVLALAAIAFVQGRADAKVGRLAVRVDSLAVSLGDVVTAVDRGRAAPADTVEIGVGSADMARGNEDAPVTMVEFLDYECPFCRRFHTETMPILLDEYVDAGKLRIVVRDKPLPMHDNAVTAARAVRCAAEQDHQALWPFADKLATAGTPLSDELISDAASENDLDPTALSKCVASGRHDAAIEADAAAATRAGVTGTPTFIVGPSDADGRIRGRVIRGAYPIETFRSVIDGALATISES